ncbi:LysR family transcriptional regulator [Pseudothauera nasutitermitis]|uniref:LysR family transcriptional regulator n=1 Tax=Pseudothauera nasutitermitis TaxID=2565930 RepID=A0A4S4ASL0_9RHOO|nr:LysR family transcriptional regulator [Pseudothauera nasutitermitis]THF62853.1 LysR family transcriptional regulator [Pseudothauera nasutitermitis]
MNWDDLRFLSVLGRCGTLTAAARVLAVDQTTVARRLRALEGALGTALFVRADGAWRPTAAGERVLERAARIEEDIAGLARAAREDAQAVRGTVRVTSVGAIVADYLVPRLPALYTRHPQLDLDLIASNDNLSVARSETDLAIRLARPASGDFLIRKLADCAFAVYGPAGAGRAPAPGDWVAYGEDLAHTPEMRWLAEHLGDGRVRLRTNSLAGLVNAVLGGIGRGVLPCFVGDALPGLARVSSAPPPLRSFWLLVHREARRQAAVAAVADWLVDTFRADAARFAGGKPARAAD